MMRAHARSTVQVQHSLEHGHHAVPDPDVPDPEPYRCNIKLGRRVITYAVTGRDFGAPINGTLDCRPAANDWQYSDKMPVRSNPNNQSYPQWTQSIGDPLKNFDVGDADGGTPDMPDDDDDDADELAEPTANPFSVGETIEGTVTPEAMRDDGQTGLDTFEDARQADVNPDAIAANDPRIADLPAFLADRETPDVTKYTPGTGGPDECHACNATHPWHHPLERGVDAVRPGGLDDGDPEFYRDHSCDKETKACDVCGCPACNSKSIEYRTTKTPAHRCNACGLTFINPVRRTREDEQRVRLYWRCGECGATTQAPFAGIPADLLADEYPHHDVGDATGDA